MGTFLAKPCPVGAGTTSSEVYQSLFREPTPSVRGRYSIPSRDGGWKDSSLLSGPGSQSTTTAGARPPNPGGRSGGGRLPQNSQVRLGRLRSWFAQRSGLYDTVQRRKKCLRVDACSFIQDIETAELLVSSIVTALLSATYIQPTHCSPAIVPGYPV